MAGPHDHEAHDHDADQHGRGHANDQGLSGMLRYLKHAPRLWRSSVNDAVVELLAPVRGELVVDIGAGMGAGAVPAAKRKAQVLAIEPTPFLRTVLRVRKLLTPAGRRISVLAGAAEKLPLADNSVAAVWSVNTMHHWSDPAAGASEIMRVLGPGGRVVLIDEDFQDPTHPDYERFGKARAKDDAMADDDTGHSHGFSMVDAEAIATHFRAAGLERIEAGRSELDGRPVLAIAGWAAGALPAA